MLRVVPSRGEGGGSATWDGGPNMCFFLNEPSPSVIPFWKALNQTNTMVQ